MEPRDVAVEFNNCINNQDIVGLARLMSEDYRFIDSKNGGFQGKEKSVKIWKVFFEKYPDYRNVFDNVIGKGELVIMTGRSICSNKKLGMKGIWTAKIKDNKVVEWRVYEDTEENRKLLE